MEVNLLNNSTMQEIMDSGDYVVSEGQSNYDPPPERFVEFNIRYYDECVNNNGNYTWGYYYFATPLFKIASICKTFLRADFDIPIQRLV